MKLEIRPFSGPHDWGWINKQVGILQVEDTCGIMGIDAEKNETVAACVMDNWTNNSVQCHFMVTDKIALKHGFLQECCDFVFNHNDIKYVYGMVPSNNEKAIKLNEHMGFTIRTRLPDAFADGVDYLIMELIRENCKYLPVLEVA